MHFVLDGHSAHRSRKVRAWPAAHPDRIELHFLPFYSPELNPDELVNADLKRSLPMHSRARYQAQLAAETRGFFYRRQRQPHIIRGYFGGPHVRYILEWNPLSFGSNRQGFRPLTFLWPVSDIYRLDDQNRRPACRGEQQRRFLAFSVPDQASYARSIGAPSQLIAEVGMDVTVGTFNLNNLFSRFNFRAEIEEIQPIGPDGELTSSYVFDDPEKVRVRTYKGKLVKGKDPEAQKLIAKRISTMDVDVLAVQEVEDIDTLRFFAAQHLGQAYKFLSLIEGNDPRLIDLAVLSKFPVGAVTSWQHAVHPEVPGERVFSRDLLEVEILDPRDTDRPLLTVFNNHLKSQFVEHGLDPEEGKAAADARRRRQAESIARIVAARTRPDGRFIVLGDMNDTPGAPTLAPLATPSPQLTLKEALDRPQETRQPKADDPPPPPSGSWTHRFKESGQHAQYELFDQIWLSQSLTSRRKSSHIDRRTRHGGDGSDHDPAWVVLDF